MASGNLGGRLGWAAISDKIGTRTTFNIFTFGAVPIFAALPYCIEQVVMNPTGAMAPVYLGKVHSKIMMAKFTEKGKEGL